MAWLQSSFTSHHLLGESSRSNARKGYKVGSVNTNSDPDKSDTPLLHDSSQSPENENTGSDFFGNNDTLTSKPGVAHMTNKSSLLSSSIFDRSGTNTKLKYQQSASQSAADCIKKPTENKKVLNVQGKKKESEFDEEEDDSEDDWLMSTSGGSGGYQRVGPNAD